MGDDAVSAIILSMADVMSIPGPSASEEYKKAHISWSMKMVRDYYTGVKARLESPNLVNGDDLTGLGMAPGPEMGRVLSLIRNAQDSGEVNGRKEALEMAKRLAQRLG
jgi:hypothetical protein